MIFLTPNGNNTSATKVFILLYCTIFAISVLNFTFMDRLCSVILATEISYSLASEQQPPLLAFNPEQCESSVALLWLYRETNSDIVCLFLIISTTTVLFFNVDSQSWSTCDCHILKDAKFALLCPCIWPDGALCSSGTPFFHAKQNKTKSVFLCTFIPSDV